MEDNEIIKALECCYGENMICDECTLEYAPYCVAVLLDEAHDLIQRQQKRITHLETLLDDRCDKCIEREREDAVHSYRKDLVEKLEERKKLNIEMWESSNWMPDKTMYGNLAKGYEEAIAIVQGVSNDDR